MGREITKLWSRLGFTRGGPDEPMDSGPGGQKWDNNCHAVRLMWCWCVCLCAWIHLACGLQAAIGTTWMNCHVSDARGPIAGKTHARAPPAKRQSVLPRWWEDYYTSDPFAELWRKAPPSKRQSVPPRWREDPPYMMRMIMLMMDGG